MSVNNEATNFARFLGEQLNDFIYEGRPKQNIRKEHTKEECLELLEEIRRWTWDNCDSWERQLGWRD